MLLDGLRCFFVLCWLSFVHFSGFAGWCAAALFCVLPLLSFARFIFAVLTSVLPCLVLTRFNFFFPLIRLVYICVLSFALAYFCSFLPAIRVGVLYFVFRFFVQFLLGFVFFAVLVFLLMHFVFRVLQELAALQDETELKASAAREGLAAADAQTVAAAEESNRLR